MTLRSSPFYLSIHLRHQLLWTEIRFWQKTRIDHFLVLWNHYMSLGCDSLFSFPSTPPWQEDGWSFKFRFVFSPSKNTVFLVTLIFQLGWIQSLLCFIRTGNFQDGWPRPKFYFWIILLLLADEDDGNGEGGDDEGITDDGDFSRDRSSCSKSRGGYTAVGRSTNSDTSKVPARYLREILNS